MAKFGRVVQIFVGGREYTNDIIDIDFMYTFDDEMENNVSEINLWNSTLAEVPLKSPVILNAGYEGDVGVVLIGEVGDFETNYHNADRELKLYVSDGLNLWGTKFQKTYENMSASAIISDMLNTLGIGIGKVEVSNDINYDKLVLNGTVEKTLGRIAKDTNSKFFIRNTKGYFVTKEHADHNAVFLNENSGLLGSPTKISIGDDVGWKIQCLLEHRISVGSYVQVESKTANGNFRVVKGSHHSDFTTDMEVLPI